MKMKKIISALAVGAVAVGFAAADLSIGGNFKESSLMYRYNTGNLGGSQLKQKSLFGLGEHSVNDNLTMSAKGNIFAFYATLVPYIDTYDGDESTDNWLLLKRMKVEANLGNFTLSTGWDRDSIKVYDYNTNINGADEGRITGGAYKLGSGFGGPAAFSNSQAGIGKDQSTYFAHAKYAIPLGDAFTLNVAASAISPHGITKSQVKNVDSKGNAEDNSVYNEASGYRYHEGIAWGVFVNPVVKKIVGFDLFAKGWESNSNTATEGYNFLFGGYANLLAVPVMNTALLGGSVLLGDDVGHMHLKEWNVDLSLGFQLGDSNRVKLTFNNKFAFKDGGGTVASDMGWSTKYAYCEYMLWDVLGVSFKLNDTLTLIGTVGQQSGFKGVESSGKTLKTGTSIFVYPHAQIFASSAASVTAGAVLTLDKLGYKEVKLNSAGTTRTVASGNDKKMAILVNVPVVVKIQL